MSNNNNSHSRKPLNYINDLDRSMVIQHERNIIKFFFPIPETTVSEDDLDTLDDEDIDMHVFGNDIIESKTDEDIKISDNLSQ